MDYDGTAMPETYDAGRGYRPAVMAAWLDTIARWVPTGAHAVLDLGCGTGRYSGPLAARFASRVVAVDPSEKMLTEAVKKHAPNVCHVRATAEALPFADGTFDMVFMSMVFHHFGNSQQAVHECRRVLRPGGLACLRGATFEQIANYAYVPFFPTARKLLDRTFQSKSSIEAQFIAEGFRVAAHELVSSEVGESWSAYADRLAYRADSILIQLPDQDFEEGLRALRKFASNVQRPGAVTEPVDFFVFQT